MIRPAASVALALLLTSAAPAAEISTHVLDLARGVGGKDVPVMLWRQGGGGTWSEVARARTDADGRVRAFAPGASYPAGVYKLQFDLSTYPAAGATPFFPEIDLVFRVSDPAAHYHVPVVVSPLATRPTGAIEHVAPSPLVLSLSKHRPSSSR